MQEETNNQEAELETTTEATTAEETKDSKKDPLDEISDLAELREKAKGFRSIANRLAKKPTEEDKPQAVIDTSNFVTKKDLEDRNEASAKELMTTVDGNDNDNIKAMKEALAENWSDISTYYVNRSGREKPEQIAKDLRAAYLVWADEQGKEIDLSELAITTVLKGGGNKKPEPVKQEDPRFKGPKSPKDWYKKPE